MSQVESTRLIWCERILQNYIKINVFLSGSSRRVRTLSDLTRLDLFGVSTALL